MNDRRLSLCVYCGSSSGRCQEFAEAARALGNELARRKVRLVYGGGSVGLMGILADAVLEAGGHVTGVIPEFLARREVMHQAVDDLRIVPDMHTRKAIMAREADAFLALPGGYGTLEEIFEVITWKQLGLHQKPIGLLNLAGFYDGLITQLQHSVAEHLIRPRDRGLVLIAEGLEVLLDDLLANLSESHSSDPPESLL